MTRKRKLILFLALPLATLSLLLIYRAYGVSQIGRFAPVSDRDEQSHGVVFDSSTGRKCSIYPPSKQDTELRATFVAMSARSKPDSIALARFDAFKSAAKENEAANLERIYFIAYGPCTR